MCELWWWRCSGASYHSVATVRNSARARERVKGMKGESDGGSGGSWHDGTLLEQRNQ